MTTKNNFTNKHLSPAKKAWITRKIKSGKSKYQTAKELDLHKDTVYRLAKHLPSKPCGWPGIRGQTLDLLQELITKGYVVSSCKDVQCRYISLRKYFPTIHRVKMYSRHIFYLEGKEDLAVREFLRNVNKKIISYHELKQVTKVFAVDLSRQEKDAFLLKNQSDNYGKKQGQKSDSLLKKDDSFSFFYIREYCKINYNLVPS